MNVWYVDTSAALKLLIDEPESTSLVAELDSVNPTLAACYLVEAELRRVVQRVDALGHAAVTDVLEGVDLYDVPASMFREAGYLGDPSLRSLDALHLAAAIRIGVDAVLTYDTRLADAARALGIAVVAPGLRSSP